MKSRTSRAALVMQQVNESVERFNKKEDGTYEYALFEAYGHIYCLYDTGALFKCNLRKKCWKQVGEHACKRGIYPERVIAGVPVKSYVLSMTCLTDGFFEKYYGNDKMVVNHCVIAKGDRDNAPVWGISSNPSYLELATTGDNTRHGNFVKQWGLYGVYVSAADVSELGALLHREVVKKRNPVEIVVDFYRNRGLTQQLVF